MERGRRSHYAVLGVQRYASQAEVGAAYKRLAMKWHPDRWCKEAAAMAEEAKRRFQTIQQAYQVLSSPSKRTLYDFGLYDEDETEEEEVEGFVDFMQEMSGLMAEVRSEGKSYSLQELWDMLQDMVGGVGFDASPSPPPVAPGKRPSKKNRAAAGGAAAVRSAADALGCMA